MKSSGLSLLVSLSQVIQNVERGRLLECPRLCPEDVYKVMVGCWRRRPLDRLTIRECRAQLMDIRFRMLSFNCSALSTIRRSDASDRSNYFALMDNN